MKHISEFLTAQKIELGWGNQMISTNTGISLSNISKHMNGGRTVSDTDLKQYSKCFKFDYENIKKTYSLTKIEICKDGTMAEVLKIGTGVLAAAGASILAYKGVETLIDKNCKHVSK